MKNLFTLLTCVLAVTFSATAQQNKAEFFQGFENLEAGKDVSKVQKKKLNTWGKVKFTVTEEEGKGFNKSNKYASSSDHENATLVLYRDLEVGATYVFSAAVKITGTNVDWQTNYSVKVASGKKGDIHQYGTDKVKEPEAGKWQKHEIEFTVIEGRENVMLQVYRWAKDVTLNVDDFKLVKK